VKIPPAGSAWSFRWASPPVLLPLLGLLWALAYWLSGFGGTLPPPAQLAELPAATEPRRVEAAYLVVDARGLERPGFAEVALPVAASEESARLGASLLALRDDLVEAGVWPALLPAARGVVLEVDRRRIALLDLPPLPAGMNVDIASELMVVRSLQATAQRVARADVVRMTVAGEEALSLWGAIALPR